ncbi:MAG: XTP/dITP diphosphatase [Dethiobacter sp.]|jgi:XTP/dITP diphosphohydrolase|nr:XTP/dITP diphosphatase [Dethiobacter sp.]
MKKLVAATGNMGKLREFRELLVGLELEVVSLADFPSIGEIEESGKSFAENAILKAESVSLHTGEFALADDSGLEVDALGGRPGIFSARFAGIGAKDAANNKKLLAELAAAADSDRTARFRAAIAVAAPCFPTQVAEGECAGLIIHEPRGTGGFGYDPLFFVPELGKTFAEMTPAEKNSVSHRARAMSGARKILKQILQLYQ